jgi:CubicO group peptidase (beta-lactamase class C family)
MTKPIVFAESQFPVEKLNDEADLFNPKITNAELTDRIASLPLIFHPGRKWHHSVATDVVGYLVEVLSGMPLADFMQERIYNPLGMVDTAFHVDQSKSSRFCTLYGKTPDSDFGVLDFSDFCEYQPPVAIHSGGAWLASTTDEYLQFTQCILNKGELNGARLL